MFGVFHIYVTRMVVVPFSFHIWFSWSVVVFQFSSLKLVWVNSCHVVVLKRGDWSHVSKASDGHHWSLYFGLMFITLLFWLGIYFTFSSHSGKSLTFWPHLILIQISAKYCHGPYVPTGGILNAAQLKWEWITQLENKLLSNLKLALIMQQQHTQKRNIGSKFLSMIARSTFIFWSVVNQSKTDRSKR